MMKNLTKKKLFVGIDISQDVLDIALIKEDSYGTFNDKQVENSFNGFEQMQEWLIKQKVKIEECLFCMEHTGTYGLLLFAWLSQMNLDYCVEPGLKIKRSLGLTRGKNDKIDARRLADYAYTNKAKLESFELPSTLIIQIKQFLTYREQLVKIKTSLKNSLKSHKTYQKVSGISTISDEINAQVEDYQKRVKDVEMQIIKLITQDPEIKKNFELATSVKGIGLVIAAFMLVTTNNFTGFENGRKYACYSGIAPFEYSSGSSIKSRTQVSQLGNKKMKSLLSNGANSAYKYDPEIRSYYKRKKEEGKDHKLIINAISCKLVNRVFATVKRKSPFVTIYQQNFA
jgi:transposase